MWEKILKSDTSIYGDTVSSTNNTSSSFTFEDLKKLPIFEDLKKLPIIDYTDIVHYSSKPEYKMIGTIPSNTHIYKRILNFWNSTHLNTDYFNSPFDAIVIVENATNPTLHWDARFWEKGLYISQEWLKNFINQKELAELTAIRMLGNAK